MKKYKLHKNFALNGKSFKNIEELLLFSKTGSEDVFFFLKEWFNTDDYIAVKTSGSTGKPVTIQLKKEHMTNSALATGSYFDVHEKTKALLCLSVNYIAGKMMLVRALVLGWYLDVVEPISSPLEIAKGNYDFCAMVPLQLHNSLLQLHRIRKLIVGGSVVSSVLIEKLKNVPAKVYATYGMTETITHIAVKPLNIIKKKSLQASLPMRQGGTTRQSLNYETLPNVKISTDMRDCLVIDAPKVSDIQIITNDIVELISGTEFKWLGRYDTIINSGGIKLIPEQIEKKLGMLIDGRFFVAGIPDEVLGERLVLIVEDENYMLNKESDTIKSTGIRNDKYTRNFKSLSTYEIPKETYIVKKFIETGTKKIQRQKTLDLIFK